MERPAVSLWWSGFAGGLSISFSLLGQAALMRALPDAPWAPLVASFGYSIGFLMVILARQQLFTETTITLVLPLLADFSRKNLVAMARMWGLGWRQFRRHAARRALLLVHPGSRGQPHAGDAGGEHAYADRSGCFEMRCADFGGLSDPVWSAHAERRGRRVSDDRGPHLSDRGRRVPAHLSPAAWRPSCSSSRGQQSVAQMLFGFIAPVLIGNILGEQPCSGSCTTS